MGFLLALTKASLVPGVVMPNETPAMAAAAIFGSTAGMAGACALPTTGAAGVLASEAAGGSGDGFLDSIFAATSAGKETPSFFSTWVSARPGCRSAGFTSSVGAATVTVAGVSGATTG